MPMVRLNSTQVLILNLVAQGCSNQAIAERLGLTTANAAYHLRRLFRLTGVRSRLQLALWWAEHDQEVQRLPGELGPASVSGVTGYPDAVVVSER